MAGHGGSRNRSGPPPDLNSGASDRKKLTVIKLPAAGYDGRPPAWPLPTGTTREKKVWRELWKTPQAAQWAKESWRWYDLAIYVTLAVRAEKRDSPASLLAQIHRFKDQHGLTPAGLRDNGWIVAHDELAVARAERAEYPPEPPRRRLRAVK